MVIVIFTGAEIMGVFEDIAEGTVGNGVAPHGSWRFCALTAPVVYRAPQKNHL